MMNGQKVIKVFCHEEEAKAPFDAINDAPFSDAEKANRYANMLMPHSEQHRERAVCGGGAGRRRLLLTGAPNISISGLAFSISIVVPF